MIKFLDLKKINDRFEPRLSHAIKRVVESGRYIGGAEVDRFEEHLTRLVGVDYVIPTGNGLDALTLIIEGYKTLGDFGPNDEIIVPANTYIASFLAVWRAGLKPVAVDADPTTMNIDFNRIEEAISPRTKAIMPVHLYGRAAFDKRLVELKERYNLKVIEDCAQSIGARVKTTHGWQSVGSIGDAGAFSFYPTKNIGALGDGGAVTTNDSRLAKVVRALANYGSDRRYHNIYKGVNSRLDAIQEAVINVKLESLDEITERRIERAKIYDSLINNNVIVKPGFSDDYSNVFHQYVVRTQNRDELRHYLEANGIETDCHYNVAAVDQPCCSSEFIDDYNVSRSIAATCVSLPIGDHLDSNDCEMIAGVINNFRASR